MGTPVKDPDLIRRLNAAQKITDPDLVKRLNAAAAQQQQQQTRVQKRDQGQPRKDESWADWAKRTASWGGRELIGGVGDVVNQAYKIARPDMGIGDQMLPEQARPETKIANAAEWVSNKLGLQHPQTAGERIVGAGVRVVPSLFVPGGGAKTLGAKALEATGGVLSGMAGQGVAEAGGGPLAQLAASLGTGVAVPSALNVAGREASNALAHTHLSASGGKRAAAQRLQQQTRNIPEALAKLEADRTVIPGSKPLASEVARDPQMAALERSMPHTDIVEQRRASAVARQNAVEGTIGEVGDPNAVQAAASRVAERGEADLGWRQRRQEQARQRLAQEAEARRTDLVTGQQSAKDRLIQTQQNVKDLIVTKGQQALSRLQAAGQGLIKARETQGAQAAQRRLEKIGNPISVGDSGANAATELENAHNRARIASKAAYSAIPDEPVNMNAGHSKRMFDDINEKVDNFFATPGNEQPPETVARLKALYNTIRGGNLTTKGIVSLDQSLADFAGDAYRSGNSGGRKLGAFTNQLRDVIDNHTSPHTSATFKEGWANARATRKLQGDTYESSRLGPIIASSGFNKGVGTPELELARKLVTSGDPGGELGRQLKAAIPNHAEELVRNEMRRLAEEGQLDSRAAIRKYQPVLDQFPEVKADVVEYRRQLAKTQGGVAVQKASNVSAEDALAAQTQQQTTQYGRAATRAKTGMSRAQQAVSRRERIQSQWTARSENRANAKMVQEQQSLNDAFHKSPLGKTIADQNTDPVDVISRMLKKPDSREFHNLVDQVREHGDEDTMNGLRRAMADHIERNSTSNVVGEGDKFLPSTEKHLNAIDDVLRHDKGIGILDDNQRQMLEAVRKELAGTQYAKGAGVPEAHEYSPVNVPTKEAVVRQAIKLALSTVSNKNRVNNLIRKGLLDPDLAAKMLKRPTYQRRRDIARALRLSTVGAVKGAAQITSPDRNQ